MLNLVNQRISRPRLSNCSSALRALSLNASGGGRSFFAREASGKGVGCEVAMGLIAAAC